MTSSRELKDAKAKNGNDNDKVRIIGDDSMNWEPKRMLTIPLAEIKIIIETEMLIDQRSRSIFFIMGNFKKLCVDLIMGIIFKVNNAMIILRLLNNLAEVEYKPNSVELFGDKKLIII